MNPPLFELRDCILNSGCESNWKINVPEAFDWGCWEWAAYMIAERSPPFGAVEGVPRGGLPLERALMSYITHGSKQLLIVDDVFTTGQSMEKQRKNRDAIGYVVFDRGQHPRPEWIKTLWRLEW